MSGQERRELRGVPARSWDCPPHEAKLSLHPTRGSLPRLKQHVVGHHDAFCPAADESHPMQAAKDLVSRHGDFLILVEHLSRQSTRGQPTSGRCTAGEHRHAPGVWPW